MYPMFHLGSDLEDVFNTLSSCCTPRRGTSTSGETFANSGARKASVGFPAVRIWEDNEAYTLEAEMPGAASEKIDISVEGNVLSIRGSRENSTYEGKKLVHQDRTFTEFERTLSFGSELDSSKVTATFKDGILTIALPKSEKSKSRKVPINVQ